MKLSVSSSSSPTCLAAAAAATTATAAARLHTTTAVFTIISIMLCLSLISSSVHVPSSSSLFRRCLSSSSISISTSTSIVVGAFQPRSTTPTSLSRSSVAVSSSVSFSLSHRVAASRSLSRTPATTTTRTTALWGTNTNNNKKDESGGGGGRVSAAVQDTTLLEKTTTSQSQSPSKPPPKLATQPVRGTRDFYPEDMRQQTWLFQHWTDVATLYGFQQYDAPVLEQEVLYTRKAGEDVTEQLYNFVDKGDRKVALRPEMTPSLARMVLARQGTLPQPLKWFALPQCWRYERTSRGRRREHYQWNMDVWGVAGVEAEVELLAAMITFFQRVGLTPDDVGINLNSRLIISEVLAQLDVPADKFAPTCVLIDKLDKVPLAAIQDELADLGLAASVVTQLTTILRQDATIDEVRDVLGPDSAAVQQITDVLALCDAYGITDWVTFNASIVRGLSYYTGVVFEAFDKQGELRAIAGGGRYDTLLATFGGAPTPACGFGFGDAVIIELLQDRKLLPDFSQPDAIHTVVYAMTQPDNPTASSQYYATAIRVASLLRGDHEGGAAEDGTGGTTTGSGIELILDRTKKPKWVFKHADRLNAKYCAIIGPDEYELQAVSMKNLQDGTQTQIPIAELATWMSEYRLRDD